MTYSLENGTSRIKSVDFQTARNVPDRFDPDFLCLDLISPAYSNVFQSSHRCTAKSKLFSERVFCSENLSKGGLRLRASCVTQEVPRQPGSVPGTDTEKMNFATFSKPYLHAPRTHTGRPHTLCVKACMTHTNTHTIGAGNLARKIILH